MERHTTQNRLISIVMCTYNGELYIREQLDSIVSQTYPVYELIIQDDHSTDNTVKVIEEYADKYPYIHVYRNTRNLGFNRNFKKAILRATGEFIAISDQDDIWMPGKIAEQVKAIGEHDICFSSYYRGPVLNDRTPVVSPLYNMERLLFTNCIPGHSMLVRQSFTRLPEVWNPHICYDWWFLICACFHNGIVKIDTPLNWHRSHPDSAIAAMHHQHAPKAVQCPTYQPYLFGISHFYQLQEKESWNSFYTYVYQHTGTDRYPLSHRLSGLLLRQDPAALLHLCLLCLKHKGLVYPNPKTKGIMAYIRGFFYPLINAYNNTNFEL